jgi:hypothetical protein
VKDLDPGNPAPAPELEALSPVLPVVEPKKLERLLLLPKLFTTMLLFTTLLFTTVLLLPTITVELLWLLVLLEVFEVEWVELLDPLRVPDFGGPASTWTAVAKPTSVATKTFNAIAVRAMA